MSVVVGFHSSSARKRKLVGMSRSNYIEGTADEFAGGGKRSKDANGSMSAIGNAVLARSRAVGAGVTTPQCLVNLASQVAKNEKQLRALGCKGNPNDWYGKPAVLSQTFDVHKGQIVLHRRTPGGSFRTNAANTSNIPCMANMNGVSISNTRLFGVAVAQVESSPESGIGNNQTTTTWHGVQTVINYSDQRWNAGDLLIADPFPITIRSQNGETTPVVYGPKGVPQEALNIVLRPWSGMHLSNLVNHCEDIIRLRLGSNRIQLQLQAATTSAQMLSHIHAFCDSIFSADMVVSPDNPLRGYAVLYAADRLLDMIKVDWRALKSAKTKKDMDRKEYGNYMRIAMLCKLQAVIDVEDKYIGATNEYAASLPHNGDHVDAQSTTVRAQSTLRSKYLMNLVTPDPNRPDEHVPRCMLEFDARIKMHTDHAKAQYIDRMRDHYGALHAGVCLSSCEKGCAADVFIGKTA